MHIAISNTMINLKNGSKIVAIFPDADLVGIQHSNGGVGIYAEINDGEFMQISAGIAFNEAKSGSEIAADMMKPA